MTFSIARKAVLGFAISAAFAASSAFAAPAFTVAPSSLAGSVGNPALSSFVNFTADEITASSSELLHLDNGAGTVTGSGWISLNSFDYLGNALNPFSTALNGYYKLILTFSLDGTLKTGTAGMPNSTYDLTNLTFDVFATGADATTSVATLTQEALVTWGSSGKVKLGSGSLIPGSGVAGFDDKGGVFQNAAAAFGLTAEGEAFFVQPQPFYTVAFDAFNNTSQGATFSADGSLAAISAGGKLDFNGKVPEPTTASLIGMGLLGLGALSRKRKAS